MYNLFTCCDPFPVVYLKLSPSCGYGVEGHIIGTGQLVSSHFWESAPRGK